MIQFFYFKIARMGMSSEIELPVSKQNTVTVGGNLVVNGTNGSGAATAVLRHQLSSASSIDFMATAGLRSLIGVQTFRWEFTFSVFSFPISHSNSLVFPASVRFHQIQQQLLELLSHWEMDLLTCQMAGLVNYLKTLLAMYVPLYSVLFSCVLNTLCVICD